MALGGVGITADFTPFMGVYTSLGVLATASYSD